MSRERATVRVAECGADDHLRAAVLRLGELLGWEYGDVLAFTEGLTGCRWDCCGAAELALVLDEYQTLLAAIEAKHARRVGQEPTQEDAAADGGTNATPA